MAAAFPLAVTEAVTVVRTTFVVRVDVAPAELGSPTDSTATVATPASTNAKAPFRTPTFARITTTFRQTPLLGRALLTQLEATSKQTGDLLNRIETEQIHKIVTLLPDRVQPLSRSLALDREMLDEAVYVVQIEFSAAYREILGTYASLDSACRAAEDDARARPRILAKRRKPVALDWRGDRPTWSATGLAGITYWIVRWPVEP